MKMEIWKNILQYSGYYASNFGRIKSLKKKYPKILSASDDGNGYLKVTLRYNDKTIVKKVHKLIAMAFLNHNPCGFKKVVNHKNFIRNDNSINNLEIITQRENSNLSHISHSSKFTGVSFDKKSNKWRSCIQINGKFKHIGLFIDEKMAAEAYQKKLKEIIL